MPRDLPDLPEGTEDERQARRAVAEGVDYLEMKVIAKAQEANLSHVVREEVQRIARKYFRGRTLGLFTRFTPEEARFLHMMLLEAAAEHPRLRSHLSEYARYLGRNYPYEWCVAPATAAARQEVRDLLLRQGESAFGETPLAPAVAFVRYHYATLGRVSLTDLGLLYNRAYKLHSAGYFINKWPDQTAHWDHFKAPEETPEAEVELYEPEPKRRSDSEAE